MDEEKVPFANPESYFFGSYFKGKLRFEGKQQTIQGFNVFLTTACNLIGILGKDYSSHGLRKGGCRYKLLFAICKWSVQTIIEWASWSYNVDSKILFAYLIRESREQDKLRVKQAMKYGGIQQSVEQMHERQIEELKLIQSVILLLI